MLATQDVWPSSTAHLTNDERRERLRAKTHVVDLMLISLANEAAEFAATDAWDEDGSASAIDWMRFNCRVTSTVAANLIAVGERMSELPESTDAMMEGRIGFAHLTAMTRTADAVGPSFDEAALLNKAEENSPGKFYYICKHYRHAADRKGFEAEQAELVENRKLSISTCEDGAVLVNGVLDPVGGAAFRTAIAPLARKSGAHDGRSLERRQADALVELASGGGSQAQIQVTTSIETLLGLVGAPGAEMEFSLPVSSTTMERLACDSSIARILLDSESTVIDVGRSKRVVSEPARRALTARDGHCRWPGCDRPASWSAAHHVVHWIHGGTTDLDNLILLCHRHHQMVHEGNWQIVRGADGRMLTIPPTVTFGPVARGPD
jgi:Domain of unknown function (DUF222)/HNH endonuclease